jgi:hypothetical protein
VVGFTQYAVEADDAATGKAVVNVRMQGTTYAIANVALAVGALVAPSSVAGRVQAAIAADRVCGRVVGNPATAAGDRTVIQIITSDRVL